MAQHVSIGKSIIWSTCCGWIGSWIVNTRGVGMSSIHDDDMWCIDVYSCGNFCPMGFCAAPHRRPCHAPTALIVLTGTAPTALIVLTRTSTRRMESGPCLCYQGLHHGSERFPALISAKTGTMIRWYLAGTTSFPSHLMSACLSACLARWHKLQ